MSLQRIYDEDLAQARYFIGRQRNGDAVVVDARRDIDTSCQRGVGKTVAASALRRAGHDVTELDGSYASRQAWVDAGGLSRV